jgi:hypothetical protein
MTADFCDWKTHAGRRGIVFAGFFPFEPLSVSFFLFSARSIKSCRGFFLDFLPGEGAVVVSSTEGGSARFFPLRSAVLAVAIGVVVVLMVSAMIQDMCGELRYDVREKGNENRSFG